MAKGILYCMTTVVPGLIKIGKTTRENFESRMYSLEKNGYSNVVGLKRHFAIEVEDYDDKERLLDDIFSKSRVPNTELFALDIALVEQLLAALDGKKVYPETETKDEIFRKATRERSFGENWEKIPDGRYHIDKMRQGFGRITATMRVEGGSFIVEKGSVCAPANEKRWMPEARKTAKIKKNILQEDVVCNSPTTASWVVVGRRDSGWKIWKNDAGEPIDIYRDSINADDTE